MCVQGSVKPLRLWQKSIVFRINLWNVILVVLCYTKPHREKGLPFKIDETEDLSNMKRTLGIILALCLLVGMAPVSYAQEPIEINIYHHMSSDTARGQATEKILEMFNQEYEGIYKAVVDVNPDFPTYQEKVKAMIAAQ